MVSSILSSLLEFDFKADGNATSVHGPFKTTTSWAVSQRAACNGKTKDFVGTATRVWKTTVVLVPFEARGNRST